VLTEKITARLAGPSLAKPLAGRIFALWGLSFKPRTDDMREAPSLVIINRLLEMGAIVRAHDPEAIREAARIFGDRIVYSHNQYDILMEADALAIVTEWSEYRNPDFAKIKDLLKQPLIFDGRNLFEPHRMKAAGFEYYPIGRNSTRNCEG
jgi:UDPglucose 6-dehydrogenase